MEIKSWKQTVCLFNYKPFNSLKSYAGSIGYWNCNKVCLFQLHIKIRLSNTFAYSNPNVMKNFNSLKQIIHRKTSCKFPPSAGHSHRCSPRHPTAHANNQKMAELNKISKHRTATVVVVLMCTCLFSVSPTGRSTYYR